MNHVSMLPQRLASTKNFRALNLLLKPNLMRVPIRQFTISRSWQNSVQPVIPDDDSLFEYTNKRWLFNEKSQLASRYVRFNIEGVVEITREAAGPGASVYMKDGKRLFVKISQPNAGRARFTTASEVATMRYARDELGIPVLKVLSYCTDSQNSKTGTDHIVMEKAFGIQLSRIWHELKP
ncbi:hypothetical protein BDW69DRAFT_186474 [Aspergillus filifer]